MATPARPYLPNVTLENCRLLFKNFSGKKGRFNPEGKRNFNIALPPEVAEDMRAKGWTIKQLDPREEGDAPTYLIKVNINFSSPQPPQVTLITDFERNGEHVQKRTLLDEDTIDILDWSELLNVDVMLNPYVRFDDVENVWTASAWLHKIFVTIRGDYLDLKYADVEDSASNVLDGDLYG